MVVTSQSSGCLRSRFARALLVSLLVPGLAAVVPGVVERVGSEAAAAIAEGDVLMVRSWSDARLLEVEATPLGPVRVELRRDGEPLRIDLPPKPADFEPSRKYPVVDSIYLGAHTTQVPRSMPAICGIT